LDCLLCTFNLKPQIVFNSIFNDYPQNVHNILKQNRFSKKTKEISSTNSRNIFLILSEKLIRFAKVAKNEKSKGKSQEKMSFFGEKKTDFLPILTTFPAPFLMAFENQ
jgi:hypothetical protein